MTEQGIIELAPPTHLGPLVTFLNANTVPHICLDDRQLNTVKIADSERMQPMQELLKQFNGVDFLSRQYQF
jgi:hypothetical protein